MATTATATAKRPVRLFYPAMAALAAIIVFTGFARTYFLKGLFGSPTLSPLVHFHGLLFTSWIVLLVTQVSLVSVRRTDIHRRLGVVGGAVAALMPIVGSIVAIRAAHRGFAPPGAPPALVFLAIPLFDMVMFATLVAAAFYYRRKPEFHKRLMLVATFAIIDAAVARLPFDFILRNGPLAFFGLTDLLLIGCIIYDTASHRRLHPAFLWGALALIVSQPLRLIIGGTHAWLSFAQWLAG